MGNTLDSKAACDIWNTDNSVRYPKFVDFSALQMWFLIIQRQTENVFHIYCEHYDMAIKFNAYDMQIMIIRQFYMRE